MVRENIELINFSRESKKNIDRYLSNYKGILMDYSYSNLISLQSKNRLFFLRSEGDFLFFRKGNNTFDLLLPPILSFNQNHIYKIKKIFEKININKKIGKISNIDNKSYELFRKSPLGKIKEDRGDYIYKYNDFINLNGKSNKFKRNNINNFKKTWQNFEIEWITKNDIEELYHFSKVFFKTKDKVFSKTVSPFNFYEQDDNSIYYWDKYMTKKLLLNFHLTDLKGIKLKLYGKVVGFLLAEIINETLSVLIGKIEKRFNSGFTTMLYYIAKNFPEKFIYINLADDGGISSLEKMKTNLNPSFIEKRYTFVYEW